jgi:hypothetical protein
MSTLWGFSAVTTTAELPGRRSVGDDDDGAEDPDVDVVDDGGERDGDFDDRADEESAGDVMKPERVRGRPRRCTTRTL